MTTPALGGPVHPLRRPFPPAMSIAIIIVILLVVFGLLRSVFGHHDTPYEKIAGEMTQALQNNDLAGVEKFQNAETATQVTRAIVGRDADTFVPLGKIQRVRETDVPPAESGRGIHEFDVSFDKATVHETIRFDPDNKVVGFKYELQTPK